MILFGQIMMFILYPNEDLALFIPSTAPIDFLLLATFQPLYLIGVYFLFGDFMTSIYFPLHKIIKLNKYDYKNIEPGTEFSNFDYLYRLAIPALFCYSLLIMFQAFITPTETHLSYFQNVLPSISLNLLFLPVSCVVVSGSWILQDTGIIGIRKKKYRNKRYPPTIEGVGHYYNSAWAGFIGFTTPIGLGIEIYKTIIYNIPWQGTFSLIMQPFIMMCLLIPVSIIHDSKIKHKRDKFITKWNLEVIPKSVFNI